MNKKTCTVCGVVALLGLFATEGFPFLCKDCEEKKQLHIEVPSTIQKFLANVSVSGATGSTTTTIAGIVINE